jgi:hypothetical protein
MPGIEAAAIATNHPMNHGFATSFIVVGREAEARDWPEVSVRPVTPGYFRTVGLQVRRGRLFSDSDRPSTLPVVLINEAVAVERRTHELGIRMALGARPGKMVSAVVGHGFRLMLAGLVLGFAGAFAVTRLLETLLFGVTPLDKVTFIGVGSLLAIVALVVSYVPERRNARIQPTIALRTE